MGGSNATLSIVLQLVDQASSALQGVSASAKKSLEEIQSSADQVRNTFGLLGGAITASLGLLVKAAADTDTAQMQLNTAVNAGVAAANADTSSTSVLAKEKANLQEQLTGINAKLADYEQKANSAKGATGIYDASIAALIPKQALIKAQLDEVNNSLSLVGASSAKIAEQFQAAADANTNLGFSVDQSLASFTTLFRATDSVTESMQANQEAMDLARAKGIDLASASTLIIQAMEGNSRALKQFGINLKDGLSPAEALQELQVKLAGSAKDFVNTPWGQMDVATAKVNMLSASLGNELMPVLLNFLETITPLIQRLTDWTNAHPKLATDILLVAGAVGLLSLGISALAGVISASISVFLAAGVVIGALSLPIIALIALVILVAAVWITNWTNIKIGTQVVADAIQTALTNLGNWFKSVWADIQSTVKSGYDYIMGLLTPLINMINNVKSAAASIGSAVGSAAAAAGSNVVHAIVPHLADGGIVNGPTLALIGEAGPEAVVPLSGGAGGFGGGINITITGNNIGNKLDVRSIADAVGTEIVKALRGNQRLSI